MAAETYRSTRSGFSLVEVMMSIMILGVILTYLFESFATYHRNGEVVSQLTESQQNSRSIANLLERDIRHAGMMVPGAGALCGIDSTSEPDSIYFSDADAINPVGIMNNELGSSFPGSNVSSGSNTLDVDLSIENSSDFAYDTNGDGTLDSDFQVGGGVIIIDQGNPDRGAACGSVTAVDLANSQITINLRSAILATSPGTGVDLIAIPAHEYLISNLTLMRNNMALATGVEDLQAAYFFDDNGNNEVDAGEYRGDGVGDDYEANALNAANAREVRITLVTRTRNEDAHFRGGQPQATENRTVSGSTDGFRRRVRTSTVELRNLLIRQTSTS